MEKKVLKKCRYKDYRNNRIGIMKSIKTPFDGETVNIIGDHYKCGHQAVCLGGVILSNGKALVFKSDDDDEVFIVRDIKNLQFYERNSIVANAIKNAVEDI